MRFRVERFTEARRGDFDSVHSPGQDAGWCQCVAWWVPNWDGWGERTAEENRELRQRLCGAGEYDGLLAYAGGEPVGWCQLGPRDRLAKLVTQLERPPDPLVWAVSCFLVVPPWRGRGVASALLESAIDHARAGGAQALEGYPRTGDGALDSGEAWTGVGPLFARYGFTLLRAGSPRSVMRLELER